MGTAVNEGFDPILGHSRDDYRVGANVINIMITNAGDVLFAARPLPDARPHGLHSVFWDNAYCEYGFINGDAASFIEFAVGALKDHTSNQHMIGNTLIDVEGDEAFGEVYFHAYHKVKSEAGFDDLIVAGRYLDRYERRDGVWKMAYRSERVDWSRTTPTQDPYYQKMPDSLFGSRLDDAVYDRKGRCKNHK